MKKVILVAFTKATPDHTAEKEYAYFTDDPTIRPGDWVLVAQRWNNDYRPAVAYVHKSEGVSQADINRATNWIVGKIDLSSYKRRMEEQAKITEIRNQLRQRRAEMEDMAFFQQMAKVDPVVAGLLSELNKLDPTLTPQITE